MAEPTEIIDLLDSLALHCRAPLMDVEDRSRWQRDWCDDLAAFGLPAIRSACARWRQSGQTKFPTPGQLMPLVRDADAARSTDTPRAGPYEPWTWPPGIEADLSLVEKIRFHQAMAQHWRTRAGPMWRNGRPAGPDELPDSWRIGTARAQEHEADAARLRTLLADARQRRLEEEGVR